MTKAGSKGEGGGEEGESVAVEAHFIGLDASIAGEWGSSVATFQADEAAEEMASIEMTRANDTPWFRSCSLWVVVGRQGTLAGPVRTSKQS